MAGKLIEFSRDIRFNNLVSGVQRAYEANPSGSIRGHSEAVRVADKYLNRQGTIPAWLATRVADYDSRPGYSGVNVATLLIDAMRQRSANERTTTSGRAARPTRRWGLR